MSKKIQINLEKLQKDQKLNFNGPVQIDSPEFEALLKEIGRDAEKRRKAGKNERPFYAIDLIRQSRLGAIRLPVEKGGVGASIRDLLYVVIRLAEVDPDVAHILRAHFNYVNDFLINPNDEVRNLWLQRIADGAIIGLGFTEISNQNVGKLVFETKLTRDGDNYRLSGTKYFSTGTLYSDWVVVLATTPEGELATVIIPTLRDGVVLEDDWDGIGQKLTGSGTTKFNNVIVNKNEVLSFGEGPTPFNSFFQLILQAVIAGIVRNVEKDAAALVKSRKRSFTFAAGPTPAEDPQLQQVIGEISSIAYAAESIVLTAAESLDRAVNSAVDGVIDYDLSHEASLQSAKAKVVIDGLALRAASLLFEVGGASATKASAQLDRHWRNVRTIASHNPTVYKARTIGNLVVNGTGLPLEEVYF